MHRDDCLSVADLYGGAWVPVYYCEACGAELHYPPPAGLCWDCELERDTTAEDETP